MSFEAPNQRYLEHAHTLLRQRLMDNPISRRDRALIKPREVKNYEAPLSYLFQTPMFWINEEGEDFTLRRVIEKMIKRKDNRTIEQNAFSVFIADVHDKISIPCVSVTPKQRNQFWPKGYAQGFFDYMIFCSAHPDKKYGKIAYEINPRITFDSLTSIFSESLESAYRSRPRSGYISAYLR